MHLNVHCCLLWRLIVCASHWFQSAVYTQPQLTWIRESTLLSESILCAPIISLYYHIFPTEQLKRIKYACFFSNWDKGWAWVIVSAGSALYHLKIENNQRFILNVETVFLSYILPPFMGNHRSVYSRLCCWMPPLIFLSLSFNSMLISCTPAWEPCCFL